MKDIMLYLKSGIKVKACMCEDNVKQKKRLLNV